MIHSLLCNINSKVFIHKQSQANKSHDLFQETNLISFLTFLLKVGGFSGNTRLRTAEAYNASTDTWHTVPSMMSSTRTNFGIEVIDDSLFVVGGYNGLTTIPNVERYDVNTGEWSDICDMGISRSGLGCCVVYGIPNLAKYAAPHHNLQFSVEDDEVE